MAIMMGEGGDGDLDHSAVGQWPTIGSWWATNSLALAHGCVLVLVLGQGL